MTGMRKKVLGRGLEALIPQDLKESVSETERVLELDLDQIDPNPHQPRGRFEGKQLEELAASIESNGVLQPVVVRRNGDRYQLIVGERRFRASRIAGKATIPAIVRNVGDHDSLKLALLENLQREDLNPVEEARGYLSLKEDLGVSVKEIAEILGRDRSTVSNMIRLLNLPGEVVEMLEEGKLKAGHARAILAIDGEKQQVEWARRVVEKGYTVRDVEVAGKPGEKKGRRKKRGKNDPQIAAIEERAELALGTRVKISPRRRGGVISIEYYSESDLETILGKMGVDLEL